MAAFTVFYDANVLYPAELRNILMHLALAGLFRAKWSAAVHEEWMSSLLEKRPDLDRAKLERTRALMDKHAEDALVTGYEDLIPGLQLPDADDRHVLAAAIRGRADVIVTMNLRDLQKPSGRHRVPDRQRDFVQRHREPECSEGLRRASAAKVRLDRRDEQGVGLRLLGTARG